MRQVGTVASEAEAKTIEDYLLTQSIPTKVLHGSQGWELWVQEDDHRQRATELFEEFRTNPGDSRYTIAATEARNLRREAQRQEKERQKNFVDMRRRWQPVHGPRPLTFAMIFISVAVALLTNFGKRPEPLDNQLRIASIEYDGNHIRWRGLSEIRSGQVWRLVTPIFLHFDLLHIFFNMYILLFFGGMIETRQGTFRLAWLVVVSAVLSNLAQYFNLAWLSYLVGASEYSISGPAFGGMSGVNYALFGYVWMKSRYDPDSGLYVRPDTVVILMVWFFLCMTGILSIANGAHTGGLVTGIVIGGAPYAWRKLVRRFGIKH